MPLPTIGRVVHYTLGPDDAAAINRRRSDATDPSTRRYIKTGYVSHTGNPVHEGDTYPALVVRLFPANQEVVNIQVFLDGNDTFWATSRYQGTGHYTWAWPPRPDTPPTPE